MSFLTLFKATKVTGDAARAIAAASSTGAAFVAQNVTTPLLNEAVRVGNAVVASSASNSSTGSSDPIDNDSFFYKNQNLIIPAITLLAAGCLICCAYKKAKQACRGVAAIARMQRDVARGTHSVQAARRPRR